MRACAAAFWRINCPRGGLLPSRRPRGQWVLEPLEAISIATQNAARFIGANDWGTIQPGKLATLIVVDGRPDRDISQTRKVVSVYVKGRKIDRDSLQLARQGDPGFEPISPVDF